MPLTEKDRDDKLGRILEKIDSSSALNGGFDRLVSLVDTIKNKQEDQTEKLDQLYAPDTGLFARVKEVENDIHSLDTNFSNYTKTNIENLSRIEKQLEKIEAVNKVAGDALMITKRLQRIAGEDLQDLSKTIELHKRFSNIYWALILLAVTGFANLVWQIVVRK